MNVTVHLVPPALIFLHAAHVKVAAGLGSPGVDRALHVVVVGRVERPSEA